MPRPSLFTRPLFGERAEHSFQHNQAAYVFLRSGDAYSPSSAPASYSITRVVVPLAALTALSTLALSLYFHAFSTLFVYLSLLVLAAPLASLFLISAARSRATLLCASCALVLLYIASIQTARNALSPYSSAAGTAEANPHRRVFIVSNLHNNQDVLPFYSTALQQLVLRLGTNNTFVSIYESHSQDSSKRMLAELDVQLQQLGVQRRILMDDKQAKVGIGAHRNGRIDFLSYVRNTAMDPLRQLQSQGQRFTHVLWINDVYFSPDAILDLLDTDNGNYDQVCALDFIGNGFYDVWVMRDTEGKTGMRPWPYFSGQKQIKGLLKQEPFLVNACWNGATAFNAKWFTEPRSTTRQLFRDPSRPTSTDVGAPSSVDQARPTTDTELRDVNPQVVEPPLTLPLRFRTSPRCFSSECQLTSFDIHRAMSPLRPRIWINPRVKVAYEYRTLLQHVFLEQWWVVAPWRVFWRDGLGMALRGLYETSPDPCAPWQEGWAAPNATLAARPYALSRP